MIIELSTQHLLKGITKGISEKAKENKGQSISHNELNKLVMDVYREKYTELNREESLEILFWIRRGIRNLVESGDIYLTETINDTYISLKIKEPCY